MSTMPDDVDQSEYDDVADGCGIMLLPILYKEVADRGHLCKSTGLSCILFPQQPCATAGCVCAFLRTWPQKRQQCRVQYYGGVVQQSVP